ncbi:unnamed protein product [Blepharisma stoltei]|uniref:Uncharacterized protein n=1 Tax=Blepharisma stoltei TaxID=1481888 RepID=A0AAU9KCJ9_9CILI|nr:unnamed protein product [Blepharisma stoltei]
MIYWNIDTSDVKHTIKEEEAVETSGLIPRFNSIGFIITPPPSPNRLAISPETIVTKLTKVAFFLFHLISLESKS